MSVEKVKFTVFADLHAEIMHDGEKRLDKILQASRDADVDFVIHCGDFCYPIGADVCHCKEENRPVNVQNAHKRLKAEDAFSVLEKYNSFEKPTYHVSGNHEFDFASVQEIVKVYGMPDAYYSFHIKGWHFIVLDNNYIKTSQGKYEHYDHAQYFYQDIPYLPPEELEWLEEELTKTDEPAVIFSHAPLFSYDYCVKNHKEFAQVLKRAKARGKDVKMCINGHVHVDDIDEVDGILYYNCNSASNMWVDRFSGKRYCEKTEEKCPNLRYVIPFQKATYAIVSLDEQGVSVQGMTGRYVQPGPKKVGWKGKISPSVKSWSKKWK